ncbi:MAG: CAP domain-containing protein [Acetivibrionales bacterium]|jgi:uncharacterized YkwD family protein
MTRRLALILIIFSLLFPVSCARRPVRNAESSISGMDDIKRVKLTADNVEVKTGCSSDAPAITRSNKDSTFDVISKVEDWYAVKLPENQIGFIPEKQAKPIVVEDGKTDTTPGTTGIQVGTKTGDINDTQQDSAPALENAPQATPGNNPANSNTLTDLEQEMLSLVNEARSQNGATPLEIDMELTNVARIKSQDMIDKNYFSHNSPTYGSPFDMMKSFGINYVHAGENIAGNQTVQAAHNALMNSPGHRKNILSGDYTHIGIGIKRGSSYGNIFTQMFISKPK